MKVNSGSAITILNGIKSDYGAAIGINSNIYTQIKQSEKLKITIYPDGVDNTLIMNCIDVFEKEFLIKVDKLNIETFSDFPHARGLKTSSAISCSCIAALCKFYGISLSHDTIIQLGAKASINAKVSITGALDDAYASFLGGISYVNSKSRTLLSHRSIPLDLFKYNILLMIPKAKNPKINVSKKLDSIDTKLIIKAHDYFENDDYPSAIKYNTMAYSPFLLSEPDIITEITKLDNNISIVGLNGAGPSIYLLTKQNNIVRIKKTIKNSYPEYDLVNTKFQDLRV